LARLDCHDRGSQQVTVIQPVAENEWSASGLINLAGPMSSEKATGEIGAGKLASLIGRELNPDSPVDLKNSDNTSSFVLAQMVVLPLKSRVVVMGRMLRDYQGQVLP
jgi:hypothetical protein